MAASLGRAISILQMKPNTDVFKRAPSDLLLPSSGLSTNCIAVGFLPSEGDSASPRYTMAQINSKFDAKSSMYGWYAQIRGSTFDGSQLLAMKDDIVKSGAVFVASVMPSINFNQITPEVAKQVAAVMKKFTDEGVPVWLRFAHEVNWYVTDGTYHGTAADFQTAWKNIYNANCKGNAKVKCFWSPNQAGSAKDLQPWWPGKEYVDIVGIDCYPRTGDDTSKIGLFDRLYGDFYNTFSKGYDLPFAIGETGAGKGQKDAWLRTVVSKEVKAKYPNYISMSWFEFDKEADFRVVMTDDATLANTKKTLLAGGNESCPKQGGGAGAGSGGNSTAPDEEKPSSTGTITAPSATGSAKPASGTSKPASGKCDWGCFGWDCSATVPCQGSYTCKGGYCK
ncbi:glycoside hydrolase [Byssothecium circinans]|uniref:Glycoside hydrolase n=1 Tax=Byssothecium circinans TaxID=147558 RepID=A0A6A5T9Y3_9PLEO|nr:glycoside hydrolase [Byssothecium circinans]